MSEIVIAESCDGFKLMGSGKEIFFKRDAGWTRALAEEAVELFADIQDSAREGYDSGHDDGYREGHLSNELA